MKLNPMLAEHFAEQSNARLQMARPARFERATCRLEDGCSDPLN